MKHVCAARDDHGLLESLAADIEAAGYKRSGDALLPHRSKKHLQIWGDALGGSSAFTDLVMHVLSLFDLTLVDCWANLYRHGDDTKSWHHDNYQDRTPRPTVTIGVSLGQARELAFQNALTGAEYRVLQENGDVFAFDEPFNNVFKHCVPAARAGESPGRRISVILWASEQEHLPRVLRAKRPGMQEIIPLEVDWELWEARGLGKLSRGARAALRQHEPTAPGLLLHSTGGVEADEPPVVAPRGMGVLTQPWHAQAKAADLGTADAWRLIDLLVRVAQPAGPQADREAELDDSRRPA